MSRLVDDFLDHSRIALGKFVVTRRPSDLVSIVQAAIEALRPVATAQSVVVQWTPPPEEILINADPLRLQQAVLNLLSNAIKFSSEGGLVLVTLQGAAQAATLSIADYGQGIDEEDLPRLFNAFFQAEGALRRGGLGLGLAIARHIVESHEGRIQAASCGLGKGATFTVTLPLLHPTS